ncbi:MAG: 2-C-methyl-D-erythritol 2,4-cyclodiphosphate synthase [Phycisphaerae bacterium]
MARIGFGYDSHRLVEARPLIIGGVEIDHHAGLSGHSDGDVLLHAVTDAILGAMAAGDIGQWFPDSDPRWKGADSATFVSEAVAAARDKGYVVGNCDVVVLAEAPKLSDHREAIQQRVAALLGVALDRVGIKAKTNEQMGFVGRGEGIVAMATVLLEPTA